MDLNEKTNNPGSKQPHVDLIVDIEAVRQTDGEKPTPCPKIDVTIRRVLTHKTKISTNQSQSSTTDYEEVHLGQQWAQGFKDSWSSDRKDHENDAKSTPMRSKELILKAGSEPPLSRRVNLVESDMPSTKVSSIEPLSTSMSSLKPLKRFQFGMDTSEGNNSLFEEDANDSMNKNVQAMIRRIESFSESSGSTKKFNDGLNESRNEGPGVDGINEALETGMNNSSRGNMFGMSNDLNMDHGQNLHQEDRLTTKDKEQDEKLTEIGKSQMDIEIDASKVEINSKEDKLEHEQDLPKKLEDIPNHETEKTQKESESIPRDENFVNKLSPQNKKMGNIFEKFRLSLGHK